jgi:hypothetical protein
VIFSVVISGVILVVVVIIIMSIVIAYCPLFSHRESMSVLTATTIIAG